MDFRNRYQKLYRFAIFEDGVGTANDLLLSDSAIKDHTTSMYFSQATSDPVPIPVYNIKRKLRAINMYTLVYSFAFTK